MKSNVLKLTTFALVAGVALPFGCATSTGKSAAAPTASTYQAKDLAGSTWKLPMTSNGRDGRTVSFKPRGGNVYDVVLTNVGSQLEKVAGAYEGLVLMELQKEGASGNFTGIERVPGRDLAEVHCSISATADEMKCNNEDWVWVRES
jgi:hypothetical protein